MRVQGRSYFPALMWTCTGLFLLRVLGQIVQRWWPQAWLPPFERWQGSALPYWLLLTSQIVILILMSRESLRASRGARRGTVAGKSLLAVGLIYMCLSLTRLGIGVLDEHASVWFKAWISGAFHVVLATFLLACAGFHLRSRGQW